MAATVALQIKEWDTALQGGVLSVLLQRELPAAPRRRPGPSGITPIAVHASTVVGQSAAALEVGHVLSLQRTLGNPGVVSLLQRCSRGCGGTWDEDEECEECEECRSRRLALGAASVHRAP